MMPMIESMAVAPMNVLLRFGKYDDAIARCRRRRRIDRS
jgi:hypothetical protein